MDLLRSYWNFLHMQDQSYDIPSGVSAIDNYYGKWAMVTVAFSLIYPMTTFLAKRYDSKWYDSLPQRKKNELPSYVSCSFHHFLLVPFAWYFIFKDAQRMDPRFNYSEEVAWFAPITLGYFVADTIFYALPELFKLKFEFLIHHVLTIAVVHIGMNSHGQILRFFPHLLICDTTNIFFNIAWFLRLSEGWRESLPVKVCELLFAVLHLLIRIINLTCAYSVVGTGRYGDEMGFTKLCIGVVIALQYYWFFIIFSSIGGRLFPSKTDSKLPAKSTKED